jgi:Protein of unknown function (DUF1045)
MAQKFMALEKRAIVGVASAVTIQSMRFAVYYTPPADHPLWRAGCAWLGRDAAGPVTPPACEQVRTPWRYGFHATLKAPMRLLAGCDEAGLRAALAALAASTPRFQMPQLAVAGLSDFIALRPVDPIAPSHPLRRLADACVTELDRFRAPPTAADMQRRLAMPLGPGQQAMLFRYGYPHVLDQFRFHMTLSDRLPDEPAIVHRLQQAAIAHFADALAQPLACDALSLFIEPEAGRPLVLAQHFPLS